VRVWLQGARGKQSWPRVRDVVAELEAGQRAHYGAENTAELYEDHKKLGVVKAEPNTDLYLEHRGNGVEIVVNDLNNKVFGEPSSVQRLDELGNQRSSDCHYADAA
jgi:hypothetical protein